MKIYPKLTAYYKDKDKWKQIEDYEVYPYISQGYEVEYEIAIYALAELPLSDQLVCSRRFKKNGTACHNISFMGVTFQYSEREDSFVCLNTIINI